VEIVAVEPSDLPAIGRLHEHFWGAASDVGTMAETLASLSGDLNHVLLAARIGGECIGTATGVVCHGLYGGYDTYMVVEDMVVDPAQRRKGVASALLSRLESIARDRGCNQVILLTESVREDAVALYEANGFEARWTGFKKKL
jgi:GNAT superfamily N-acetyltransferase